MIDAFLLTRQWKDTDKGVCLDLWFRSDKKAIKVEISGQQAVFFIHQQDVPQANGLLSRIADCQIKSLDLKSFDYKSVSAVYFQSQHSLYRARDLLQKNGIRCFEADIRPTERFLTERFITGPVTIHSEPVEGVVHNPKLTPADYYPSLTIMSFDIETDYSSDELFSISFVSKSKNLTLMIGDGENTELLVYVKNESELIYHFILWVELIDPDVFIGWNVINFDFRFLQKKADKLDIALCIGREESVPVWRKAQTEQLHYFLLIPGRVVLDGIDTLKSATYSFDSFSLDSVGNELLNRGKLIKGDEHKKDPLYKAKEIKRQFHEDKVSLAAYNLEDCQLVWDIFEHTHLVDFAIERARLTGLEMDRFGGSVAAFDNLYLPRLHRKGFVAPNIGDNPGQLSAPGGYVMNSQPGFYDSVLVLDYKSLYPSIIRTFKVDPYGRIAAKDKDDKDIVPGFDGATFSKTENILPAIIEQLWQARDKAKKEKNSALSQAIKIIMNSFYGVLGTPGCRIHDSRLTSSITKRSHEIIIQTVKLIESEGYTVIYGDTDSVFVSLKQAMDKTQADAVGNKLIALINQFWETGLKEKYGIESCLEMEYETHFIKFFMPTIRGSVKGSKKRYAGLIEDAKGERKIIYKGLETVRTDWTELARHFQQGLYERIFNNQSYKEFIQQTIQDLKAGKCDHQLVYRKRLRQSLGEYIKNVPPHAQAALKAEKRFEETHQPSRYKSASWIEYVITKEGPEVLECQASPLDYEHYIEKQLTPIAETILSAIGGSIESIVQNQYELFS
ncbi:MAG: DNA polymerase II [Gammaproteobacteria bacterium]|nr:DNA polymerase II [Gammaproteobacteria bacterium]